MQKCRDWLGNNTALLGYGYNADLRIEQRVKCGSECRWKSAYYPLACVAYWALTNHASVTLRSWKNVICLSVWLTLWRSRRETTTHVRLRFTGRASGRPTDYATVTCECDRYSAAQHGRLDCWSPATVNGLVRLMSRIQHYSLLCLL